MKNLLKTFNEIRERIFDFTDSGFHSDDLYIHVPIWFKEYLFKEVSKEIIIARIEPFKFSDVEIVAGYENAIVISNSKTYQKPEKIKFYKIKI